LLDEERPYALIVFEDDDLSTAIGRSGQNVQLASDVTGYTIDAISLSEYNKRNGIVDSNHLSTVKGFSDKLLNALSENDINTKDEFESKREEILEIKGFGEKTYEKLLENIKSESVDA